MQERLGERARVPKELAGSPGVKRTFVLRPDFSGRQNLVAEPHKARTPDDRSRRAPRVYIASQVRLYREILASGLAGHDGLSVVGQGSCAEALERIAHLQPEVLLLDLAARDRLLVPRRAHLICPNLRVIAFAVADIDTDVLASMCRS